MKRKGTARSTAAVLRQRRRLTKRSVLAAVELTAPVGMGGSAPRAPREPRWQDRASRRARQEQLEREPWCRVCARFGRQVAATQVDHIKPRSEGGALTDLDNLQSLCESCHRSKSGREDDGRGAHPAVRHRRQTKVRLDPATGYPLPGQDHPWSESE